MSMSTMLIDAKAANKEMTQTIRHPDGRQTIYTTDYRGQEWFTLIGQRGQYQGTFKLERPKQSEPR